MKVRISRKSLIGAALLLGSMGLALSACTTPGGEAAYDNGYYDYSGYYDPGYLDSYGFVGVDRDHDRRRDHDDHHDHGMHASGYAGHDDYAGRSPGVNVSRSFGGVIPQSFGGAPHSFGGEGGGHGGGGGHR